MQLKITKNNATPSFSEKRAHKNMWEPVLTDEMKEGIRLIPKKDLERFFESLRQLEYVKLKTEISNIELTALPMRVKMIGEIEQRLLNL